jgi:hypothetical protein
MSAEYDLKLSSRLASLSSLAAGFDDLGLAVVSMSSECLVLARPGADVEQLRRWGGDVQIARKADHLLVTINSVGLAARVIERIRAVLIREGIESSTEEL